MTYHYHRHYTTVCFTVAREGGPAGRQATQWLGRGGVGGRILGYTRSNRRQGKSCTEEQEERGDGGEKKVRDGRVEVKEGIVMVVEEGRGEEIEMVHGGGGSIGGGGDGVGSGDRGVGGRWGIKDGDMKQRNGKITRRTEKQTRSVVF
ncbi:hypothetical protein Pcinc_042318 [Petrolisthes cinctipes]|uniref:Uncharacterized protein n=1 Tax=Petrolisthes cinctipes TaxID=88211 RepID=A0AAE1BIL1_PETCI|nr:hypothetical protein Pcinc_042318 [Petrolisthes cinctipes]